METVKRIFKGADAEMLTACDVLMDHAIACREFLAGKRANWGGSYFEEVKARIKHGFTDILGIDGRTQLSESTARLLVLQEDASNLLGDVKVQIDVDFKKDPTRRDQILNTLGYTALYKDLQSKSQQTLVELLYKFKLGLTPALKTELTEKGIDGTTLDEIVGYADQVSAANASQEGHKATGKEVTANAITELNSIYEEVIGIAQIASAFYRNDKVKQAYFSYSKALKSMTASPQTAKETTSTQPA